MSKTFRINLDIEFLNGEVLTVEHTARGRNIEEANNDLQLDLAMRVGHYIAKFHPLNHFVEVEPKPEPLLTLDDIPDLIPISASECFVGRSGKEMVYLRDRLIIDLERLADRLKEDLDFTQEGTDIDDIIEQLDEGFHVIHDDLWGYLTRDSQSEYYEAWLARQAEQEAKS